MEQLDALAARARSRGSGRPRSTDPWACSRSRSSSATRPRGFTTRSSGSVARGCSALVLDLRGCPGGDLDACLAPRRRLPRARERARHDARRRRRRDRPPRARAASPHRFPLFLLVDRGTASAAELFAGCLQAHGRAVVVGERTYGKGTAQRLVPGAGAPGARYATVATFTLPDGAPIEGRGVLPDIEAAPEAALSAALAAAASAPPPAH